MNKQTAYCEHCKCNVSVTHFIPKSHLIVVPISVTLIFITMAVIDIMEGNTAIIIGASVSSDSGFSGMFLGIIWVLSFCLLAIPIPSSSFYCEKCGKRIGTNYDLKNRCIYCDAELEPGMDFCPHCGRKYKRAKDSVTCKKCKTENTLDAKFCAKCGAKLPVPSANKNVNKKDDKPAEYGWKDWD